MLFWSRRKLYPLSRVLESYHPSSTVEADATWLAPLELGRGQRGEAQLGYFLLVLTTITLLSSPSRR